MTQTTPIEWTDITWNPVRGCSRISSGCINCYAEAVAGRFSAPGLAFEGFATREGAGGRWTGRLELVPNKLNEPLHWRRTDLRVFVNSMSDLFHEALPDDAIDRVFAVMALAPGPTFQVLTKRAERMRAYLTTPDRRARIARIAADICGDPSPDMVVRFWPLLNVWLGVSVEDQAAAGVRIPDLLATPAAVRFLSVEPLLGFVDLKPFAPFLAHLGAAAVECPHGFDACPICDRGIDWVIVGGESGNGARECRLGWIRSIVRQCRAARVPVFVKQLGAKPTANYYDRLTREHVEDKGRDWPDPDGWNPRDGQPGLEARVPLFLTHRKKGGDPSTWPPDLRVRQFPAEARRDAAR